VLDSLVSQEEFDCMKNLFEEAYLYCNQNNAGTYEFFNGKGYKLSFLRG
jgi:hypothetical protein